MTWAMSAEPDFVKTNPSWPSLYPFRQEVSEWGGGGGGGRMEESTSMMFCLSPAWYSFICVAMVVRLSIASCGAAMVHGAAYAT